MRFLIVDDDKACRDILKAILSPYGQCDLAMDGNDAVHRVRLALDETQPYTVMFLDIMMPGLDGHETFEAIRGLEQKYNLKSGQNVRIVMTTALSDIEHRSRAFEAGCECYVTKPFTPKRILEQVKALVGELHRRPPPARPTISHSVTPASSSESTMPSQRLRFLVVDDDGVCRALIKAILSPYGECTFAYDGQEAVDAVRLSLEDEHPYDLITLDIMMPGMNGHEALKCIRDLENEKNCGGSDGVKIIMTTALRDSKHCIQAFREGCECYVTKPINEQDLLRKMRELGVMDKIAARANANN